MKNDELVQLKEKVERLTIPGEIEKLMEHRTMYERFKEKAEEIPNKIAIKYYGTNITYKDALAIVDKAADGFYDLGIRYGDNVAMSMLGTPYAILSFYALDKIGSCMHMINCSAGVEEIKRELSKVPSKVFLGNDLFCSKEFMSAYKETGIEKVVTVSLLDLFPIGLNKDIIKYAIAEKVKGLPKSQYDGENILNFKQLLKKGENAQNKLIDCAHFVPNKDVTIAYTSGSTGVSKGCVASWESIDSLIQVMGMTEQGRFNEGEVMFATFPLWIYYSLLNMMHEPLCLGITVAFDPLFDPKDLARYNKMYQFNHWLTIPPYLDTVIKENKPTDCSKWKVVLTGGAELSPELKEKADEYIRKNKGTTKFEQGYGSSECLGSFAYGYKPNTTIGSMGAPCVGNIIKIVDPETKKEVPLGEIGVGYLYTPSRMKCYYADQESTNQSLVEDENGVTWYNSEDLIRVNEKNELFLVGRLKRMEMTLDENGNPAKLYPEEVTKKMASLPLVEKVETIAVPDDVFVSRPVAFVVLSKNAPEGVDLKEKLLEACNSILSQYKVPKDVIFLDEMPLNSSKKVDLVALENIYEERQANKVLKKVKSE